MKAMILGAGKGTRVRPVTEHLPKPMIPILRKPLMESMIEHLHKHGVDQIVVNTSYLAPVIENYFRDGAAWGVQIAYSYEGEMVDGKLEGEALGSAGGLKKIQNFSRFFDDTFVVVCGDAWVDVDLTEAVHMHKKRGALATAILQAVDPQEVHKYGVVQCAENGQIEAFQEKPKVEEAISNLINSGIYLFEPAIFDHIPDNQVFDIGGDLFPALAEKKLPFYGHEMDFQWLDIGKTEDIYIATRAILQGQIENYPMPGHEISPGVHVGIHTNIDWDQIEFSGPIVVGSGTRIDPGATIIGPTVIGSNCHIEAGAHVEDAMIDDYMRITSDAFIKQQMLFKEHCIGHNGQHLNIKELDMEWLIDDSRRKSVFARRGSIGRFSKELSTV